MRFFQYGEKVEGYDVLVLNEREARAGAGILFLIGILSLVNAVALGHVIVTKVFISFFTLDFLMRVIQPRYSPSLLLGRFFVQNQRPEYVGATQKRFAWGIGLMLAVPMFYLLVIDFQPHPIKVVVCIICLTLLFFEAAFSICLGCKIYGIFKKDPVTHCPGGICEIRTKDAIQTFDLAQKIITVVVVLALGFGLYSYFTKVESKTFLAKKINHMMMSDAEKMAFEEAKREREFDEF
jgi:branched-subunit amino acid transport protein AzlD